MAFPIMAALGIAGGLGKIFGGGAKQAENSRMTQAELMTRQDALKNQQFSTQQAAQMQAGQQDLQRKQFTEDARGSRAKQAAIADMLMNFSPTRVGVKGITPASISGGVQIGDGAKTSLAELYKQALAAQLKGDTFSGGELLAAPSMSQIPKAGKMEQLGGILGTLGSIAGGLAPMFGQEQGTYSALPGGPGYSNGLPSFQIPGVQMPRPFGGQ